MFRTPSNILVVGPSGSGKTVFVSELLKEPHRYFRPVPKRLHYCYGIMQPLLQHLHDDYKVGLHEGLPTATDLTRWFGNEGGILVLDDLMAEGGNDKQVLDLFTKHSHHRNITVNLPMSRYVSPGKICQDHQPSSALHRGLQESSR